MGDFGARNKVRVGGGNRWRRHRQPTGAVHGTKYLIQRGVEALNSVKDPREIYFRNRLNNLMMKPNVVKTLSADKKDRKKEKEKEEVNPESAMGTLKKS